MRLPDGLGRSLPLIINTACQALNETCKWKVNTRRDNLLEVLVASRKTSEGKGCSRCFGSMNHKNEKLIHEQMKIGWMKKKNRLTLCWWKSNPFHFGGNDPVALSSFVHSNIRLPARLLSSNSSGTHTLLSGATLSGLKWRCEDASRKQHSSS